MTPRGQQVTNDILFATYALFIFASISSIAVAQMALGLSAAVYLFGQIWWRNNPFPKPLRGFYWAMLVYVAWMFIASVAAPDFGNSINNVREDWLFIAVPIGIFLFTNPRYRGRLMAVFAVGLLVISLYGIFQHYTGVYWFKKGPPVPASPDTYRIFGGFSMRITFGNYMATALVFIFVWTVMRFKNHPLWLRLVGLAGSVLAVLATVWSYSRGSVAAIFVAIGLGALTTGLKRASIIIGVLVVILAAILIGAPALTDRVVDAVQQDFSPDYEGGRPFIWKHSFDIAFEHPLFGVGPGNFPPHYEARLRPDIPDHRKLPHAHNDTIHFMVVTGIPGAVAFLALWVMLVRLLWRGYRSDDPEVRAYSAAALAGSVAFFFTSLFEATFNDEEVRQMLMFVWAAGLWPWYKALERNAPTTERS